MVDGLAVAVTSGMLEEEIFSSTPRLPDESPQVRIGVETSVGLGTAAVSCEYHPRNQTESGELSR